MVKRPQIGLTRYIYSPIPPYIFTPYGGRYEVILCTFVVRFKSFRSVLSVCLSVFLSSDRGYIKLHTSSFNMDGVMDMCFYCPFLSLGRFLTVGYVCLFGCCCILRQKFKTVDYEGKYTNITLQKQIIKNVSYVGGS